MYTRYSIDFEEHDAILKVDDVDSPDLFSFFKWAKQTLEGENGFKDASQRNDEFYIEIDEVNCPSDRFVGLGHLSREEFDHCKEMDDVVVFAVSSEGSETGLDVWCSYGKFLNIGSGQEDIQAGTWNSLIMFLKEYGMLSKQQADELLV